MGPDRSRLSGALGASAIVHAGLVVLVLFAVSVRPERVATQPPPVHLNVYYLPLAGPAGGGGSLTSAPPRRTEIPPHLLPAPVPVEALPLTTEQPPQPTLNATITTDARILELSGSGISGLGSPGGKGPGAGVGPDSGLGAGPGAGGGGGIVPPTLVRSVSPNYTSDAMVAKLQGAVELEAVVLANGTVGEVRVTRSFDRTHGLDGEAIKAAKQWLFRPGTRDGRPVDVVITLILDFRLH
jgi:protein TonB